MNHDKIRFIVRNGFTTVDVENVSGKPLRCHISFQNGSGMHLLLDVGAAFTITGLDQLPGLPKIDADYVLDRISDKLN